VLLETAIAIPLLLAVTVGLAWSISLAGTSLALGDAVRQVARDVARGVPADAALDSARSAAPGAELRIDDADGQVVVVADQRVTAPVPVLRGISVTLSQRVTVPHEWSGPWP